MRHLIPLVFACAASISQANYLDADNVAQAATMAALEFRARSSLRDTCSELLPENEQAVQSLSLAWLDRNSAEELALTSYAKSAPASWTSLVESGAEATSAALSSLPRSVRIRHCESFLAGVRSGEQDISTKTPNVSRYLAKYLSEHPLTQLENEQYQFKMGCVKQSHNRALREPLRFDLSHSQGLCTCLWTARQAHTTSEERALEANYTDGKRMAMELPHIRRLVPFYAACLDAK